MDSNSLRVHFNFANCSVFLLRSILPLLFYVLSESLEPIFYILIYAKLIILALDFVRDFPLRNNLYNQIYLSSLMFSAVVLVQFTFFNLFSFIDEEHLFYCILLVSVLAIKLALTLYQNKYLRLIAGLKKINDFSLEEIHSRFTRQRGHEINEFIYLGILKQHAKWCKISKCKFVLKHVHKFEKYDFFQKDEKLRAFILSAMFQEIADKTSFNFNKDRLLLKYMTFLIGSDENVSKSLYEIQKMLHYTKERSYFTNIMVRYLIKKLHQKVKDLEKSKKLESLNGLSNETLEISAFFKINNEKMVLHKRMINLLQEKMKFFDRYSKGFNSYDEIMSLFYSFLFHVNNFEKKLDFLSRNQLIKENLVLLKFRSMFYSIVVNDLQRANRYEDEVENIRKKHVKVGHASLSPLLFLNNSMAVCEASFMNHDGQILESCKNEKFAGLFNYQVNEFTNVRTVQDLMPDYIAQRHQKIVFWSFNRSREDAIRRKSEVNSFGKEKQGFLFPIKLFLGLSLKYLNDFVMSAAIVSLKRKEEGVLFENGGNVIGFTEGFYQILKDQFSWLSPKQLEAVNLYSLIDVLKDVIQKNNGFGEKNEMPLNNVQGMLMLPENLEEIIEVIIIKELEDQDNKKKLEQSFASSPKSLKSIRTSRSLNSRKTEKTAITMAKINQYMTRITTKSQSLKMKMNKENLAKIFEEDMNPEQIFGELIEKSKLRLLRFIFDLNFQSHRYGKNPDEVMLVAWLKIVKIDNDAIDIVLDGFEPKNAIHQDSMIYSDLPLQMPPENVAEFNFAFQRTGQADSHAISSRSSQKNNIPEPRKEVSSSPRNIFKVSANYTFPFAKQIQSNQNEEKDVTTTNKERTTLPLENDTQNNIYNSKTQQQKNFFSSEQQQRGTLNKSTDDTKKGEKMGIRDVVMMAMIREKQTRFKRDPTKLTEESSHSNDFMERIKQKLNNNTTDIVVHHADEEEKLSGKADSVSSLKTSFGIFHNIRQIQSRTPITIPLLILSLSIQMILLLLFCVYTYATSTQYISQIYSPLESGSITQCRINIGMCFANIVINELELQDNNFTTIDDFSMREFKRIVKANYNISRNLTFFVRTMENPFNFANYLDSWFCPYVYRSTIYKRLFADMNDLFLDVINNLIRSDFNLRTTDYKIVPRNFPYYLMTALKLRGLMLDEFAASNNIITGKIVVMMIVVLSIVAALKLLEFIVFQRYYLQIIKLLNIFLRVGPKEVAKELVFLKEILGLLKDPLKSYLYVNFPEKNLIKTTYKIKIEEFSELGLSKKKKTNSPAKIKINKTAVKKMSLFNIRSMSKARALIFILLTLIVIMGYCLGVYYDWISSNDSISQLLNVNAIFNKIFFYSTATLVHNTLFQRETLIRDYDYEVSKEYYQIHENRLTYFYTLMNLRLNDLSNFKQDLIKFGIQAVSIIKDPMFVQLIQGDVCAVLKAKEFLNSEEFDYCESQLPQFQQGIMLIINDYVNTLHGETFITLKNSTNNTNVIKDFVKSGKQFSKLIANFYLSNALFYFYEYASSYYSQILNTQIGNLKIMMWTLIVVCLLLFLLVAGFTYTYLMEGIRVASGGLWLVPYEKLANDEQTIFLIRRFWREYGR